MSEFPLIVSFYTVGTPYEEEVQNLIKSCQRFGYTFEVWGVEPRQSWARNCAQKASFCLKMMKTFDCPILWLDADSVIMRDLEWFRADHEADFAIWRNMRRGGGFRTGTVFFTPKALGLLEEWESICNDKPDQWDQVSLQQAYQGMKSPPKTLWLPQGYYKIFDREWIENEHIEYVRQNQASRRFKRKVRRVG